MTKSPWDLLPIDRPLEDTNPKDSVFFYNEVVKPLILDVIKMENNGIPINLDKVKELEGTVNTVLDTVKEKLSSNPLVIDFLKSKDKKEKATLIKATWEKDKTVEDFLTTYNPKNKVHKAYFINTILKYLGREDMKQDSWTIKDLKKAINIIGVPATNLLEYTIKDFAMDEFRLYDSLKSAAMHKLAEDKVNIYRKSHIIDKVKELRHRTLITELNPGSSLQKQEFFESLGINSEEETKGGAAKWDRQQLEKLKNLISILKEKKNEAI